jgi:glycine cleavage system H protein
MSDIPADLRYAKTHEWVRVLPEGLVEVGISDHAQHALGDLVFVEVPDVGRRVSAREPLAVVESVKAASDVYAPIAGKVEAVNTALASEPERINREPYGAGWIARIRPDDAAGVSSLLAAADYAKVLEAEGD